MTTFIRRHPVLSFFLLAWLLSWVFMVPLALASRGAIPPLPGWLHYLSAYGPLLSALVVIRTTEGSPGLRAWWSRLTQGRAGLGAWIIALSPLPLYGIAAVAERLAHGAWPDAHLLGRLNFLPDLGLWSLALWLFNSGLGEESGWRGYALPALQRRFGARAASLVIACGWMVWHVPAFFYLPSYAHLGAGMAVGFFLGILSGAFLLTWLSNASRGGALLPIVWHGLFNFTTAPPGSAGTVAAVISTGAMVMGFFALIGLKRSGAGGRSRLWSWAAVSAAGCLAIGAGGTYLAYSRDLRATRDRLAAGSQFVRTPHGPIEYAAWGEGPPVLVVHGAGGGYDQGILLAQTFAGAGFRWISPSRFGYLRTPLPVDASTTAQADAFADLLDSLGIRRVAILAMSGGAPPSLQFALRHPERTSALVLLAAAPYAPLAAAEQKLPVPIWVYQRLFSSDFPFWLLQKVARRRLEPLFDVTPALRAQLPPEERAVVDRMVDGFQPVTRRVDGVRNEGAALDPRAAVPVEEIRAPTLVVHALDDHINPISVGEHTASHIRGARFLRLATGGHLLLGHHAEVRATVNAFLRRRAAGTSSGARGE